MAERKEVPKPIDSGSSTEFITATRTLTGIEWYYTTQVTMKMGCMMFDRGDASHRSWVHYFCHRLAPLGWRVLQRERMTCHTEKDLTGPYDEYACKNPNHDVGDRLEA